MIFVDRLVTPYIVVVLVDVLEYSTLMTIAASSFILRSTSGKNVLMVIF